MQQLAGVVLMSTLSDASEALRRLLAEGDRLRTQFASYRRMMERASKARDMPASVSVIHDALAISLHQASVVLDALKFFVPQGTTGLEVHLQSSMNRLAELRKSAGVEGHAKLLQEILGLQDELLSRTRLVAEVVQRLLVLIHRQLLHPRG